METELTKTEPEAARPVPAPRKQGESAPCRFGDARFQVGDVVQVEPPAYTGFGRLTSKVVGWVEDQVLLLTIPRTAKGRLCLSTGEALVVRGFTGSRAFAFECTVLKNTSAPRNYLQLSYPQSVDGVEVRNSPRFRLRLPAEVSCKAGAGIGGTVEDIGSSGALVSAESRLGEIGDAIALRFDLVLHDVSVSLALQASIRSVQQPAAGKLHYHGVAFVDPSSNDRLVLAALVWFHMYEKPHLRV